MLLGLLLLGLGTLCAGIQVNPKPQYHNYVNMTSILTKLARDHSDIATLYSIGKSTKGRELWVLKIQTPSALKIGTPHVKFVANIHGNEAVGRELVLMLAQYILKNYDADEEVKWIADRTVIHLLPSINPDGFEVAEEGSCSAGPGRSNANQIDLNRSFPDYFADNMVPAQPETLSVAKWLEEFPFVLSASFHGGALVANYPFDSKPQNDVEALKEEIMKNITRGDNIMEIWMNLSDNAERANLAPGDSPTPDDDVFKFLASTYSKAHARMYKGTPCPNSQTAFPGGITNGAAWYPLVGGMQDFNYIHNGCLELTLEVSCCKYPKADTLPQFWEDNKKAMLELLKHSQIGIRGIVADKVTSAPIEKANLTITGRSIPFTTTKNGEFWRLLLPGDYTLNVNASGYEPQSFPITVEPFEGTFPNFTWLNVYLQPLDLLSSSSNENEVKVQSKASSIIPSIPTIILTVINILLSIFLWNPIVWAVLGIIRFIIGG